MFENIKRRQEQRKESEGSFFIPSQRKISSQNYLASKSIQMQEEDKSLISHPTLYYDVNQLICSTASQSSESSVHDRHLLVGVQRLGSVEGQNIQLQKKKGHENKTGCPSHVHVAPGQDKRLSRTEVVETNLGQAISPPIQRTISGGFKKVYAALRKYPKWKAIEGSKKKKPSKYTKAVSHMLEELHTQYETGFDPEDIAQAIIEHMDTSSYALSGVEAAKNQVTQSITDYIDDEVLFGGHSGEKHWQKDEKYQKNRMKKEKKKKVTTIHDKKSTKKLMTAIKNNVCDDLLALINSKLLGPIDDNILGLGNKISLNTLNPIKQACAGVSMKFTSYKIFIERVTVKGVNGGGVTVKVVPKLVSLKKYEKTEYEEENVNSNDDYIVCYWGGNSPMITIKANDNYGSIYDKFYNVIVAPVTAF